VQKHISGDRVAGVSLQAIKSPASSSAVYIYSRPYLPLIILLNLFTSAAMMYRRSHLYKLIRTLKTTVIVAYSTYYIRLEKKPRIS